METQKAAIIATTVPPMNNFESAIVITLDPGNYTTIVLTEPAAAHAEKAP